MEPDFIYTKTPQGEEAIRSRTKVMQRNVRMVLILVDGRSTFSDLCQKTGNTKLTEKALLELEAGRFIMPKVDQDSVWAESKKVAEEIREAAFKKVEEIKSTTKECPDEEKVVTVSAAPVTPPVNERTMQFFDSQFSLEPAQYRPPIFESAALATVRPSVSKPESISEEGKQFSVPFIERIKALISKSASKAEYSPRIKPVRHGSKNHLGWPALITLALLVLAGLGYLGLIYFPYGAYLPEIESALSTSTGRTVRIGSLQVAFRPAPAMVMGKVRISAGNDELQISELVLEPSLSSLLSPVKVFRKAIVRGMSFPVEAFPILSSVIETLGKPPSVARIESVRFERMDFKVAGLSFAGMEGEVSQSKDGKTESLRLLSPDRSLNISILASAKQQTEIRLEAFSWKAIPGSQVLFDSANIKGQLSGGVLTLSSIELRFIDGLVQGSAVLQADKKTSVAGDLTFERLNANRMGVFLGKAAIFSGDFAGRLRFSGSADSWEGVLSAIVAEGDFSVKRGTIKGIDLVEAVRRTSDMPVQGGATSFEQLTGKLRMTSANHQYSGMVMNSGLLQSTGALQISSDQTISGRMDLQMRGTVNQRRVPVTISGSLQTILVQAGKK